MKNSSYSSLIGKLDAFIRKFYINQLIRGGIYSGAVFFTALIIWAAIEYFGQFDVFARGVLFYSFLGLLIFVLTKWVIRPLIKLRKIGEVLSYEEASIIIGDHFEDIKDRLLNVLQLHYEYQGEDQSSIGLLEASIDQKINGLKTKPFTYAIDLTNNKKYLKYLVFPAMMVLFLSVSIPEFMVEPTQRIWKYQASFEPQAPFQFSLTNKSLKTLKNKDFTLSVKISGNEIPKEVFMESKGTKVRLQKASKTEYSYTLKNMQEDMEFRLEASGFYSDTYQVKVLPNPVLLSFSTKLKFPTYLKKEERTETNVGDLEVPEGTKIEWLLSTEVTDEISFFMDEKYSAAKKVGTDKFTFSKTAIDPFAYAMLTTNQYVQNNDSVSYQVRVIKDQFPEIALTAKDDSSEAKAIQFVGEIKDDHGLKSLYFYYKSLDEKKDAESTAFQRKKVPFDNAFNQTRFYYYLDLNEYQLTQGKEIQYYFEVSDNDGVNGSKSSRTMIERYKIPSLEELNKKNEENNEAVKDQMAEAIEDAKKMKEELAKMNKKLLEKKELSWRDKEQLKSMIEQQKTLKKTISDITQQYEEHNKFSNEFQQVNEELLDKQEKLKELFEQLMTDEMKEMMEEINRLMEEMDKEQFQEEVEKMEITSEQIEKELDRSLELFKQLEFEQKLEDVRSQLEELKQKQDDLNKETEKSNKDELEEKEEKQKELNEEFEKMKKELGDLKKKNEDLEFPNKMDETEKEEQEIEKEMKESQEELNKKKKDKASESQKEASEQMQKLQDKLEDVQKGMAQQQAEDMNALRQILDNIISSSFDQERLIEELKGISNNDPNYIRITKEQKQIKDNIKIIEDSLFALSKRVSELKPTINKEIGTINRNMSGAIKELQNRKTGVARGKQQVAMTSLNTLGLLLDEVVQQLQKQMASKMPGNGSCNKPGQGGNPKPGNSSSMSDLQKQLNQQLKSLKEGMNKGKGKGGKQPGGKKSGGGMGMTKELAKMAAQQAALREALNKMASEKGEKGKNGRGGFKELSELMEQTEIDVVNKQITRETIRRQEEILTRLLESEKADRERDLDTKRESKENFIDQKRNPNEFLEYYKQNQKEIELLKTISPTYNDFYKRKVADYFKSISE